MKKVLLILVALLGLSIAASAQSKAIGFRAMSQWQLSYEHYVGDPNFLEFDLGGTYYSKNHLGYDLTGTYNWMVAQPDLTPRGDWGIYVGIGASVGSWWHEDKSKLWLGFAAQGGIEYTFWFPLQLSLDLRPIWGLGDYGFGFYPTLAVRYSF